MATVRLEFDLDSELYPELHQVLSALRNPQAQAERLRQLAAMGLVWENVRIYGADAIGPSAGAARALAAARPNVSATSGEPGAGPPARPARGKSKGRGKEAPASPLTSLPQGRHPVPPPDFIDLAIDAARDEPALADVQADDAELDAAILSQRELEEVANELPVLLDIVPEVVAPPPLQQLPSTLSFQGVEDAVMVEDEAIHLTALAHKPAMRSRLMRMKERGLFKNG